MDQDLAVLQNISDTLSQQPAASQRQLAKNANISLGMMNAILGRFVERGWIMLTNVNARKLAYALTAEGLAELTDRSRQFAKRTFAIASEYNDVLNEVVEKAKSKGKRKVVLIGQSYIRFLVEYVCKVQEMDFEELSMDDFLRTTIQTNDILYLVAESEDNLRIEGGVNLLEICEETKGVKI